MHGRIVAIICLILAAYGLSEFLSTKYAVWSYRLTVTVDTPRGPVAASSISKLSIVKRPSYLHYLLSAGSDGLTRHLHTHFGEAVALDLGGRKALFASTTGEGWGTPGDLSFIAFPGPRPLEKVWGDTVGGPRSFGRGNYPTEGVEGATRDEPRPLPERAYPTFIGFLDKSDPRTAQEVDPSSLSTLFGPGYNLRSIEIEITDDPPTLGKVAALLSWFSYGKTDNRIKGTKQSSYIASLMTINCFREPSYCPNEYEKYAQTRRK